MKTIGSDCYNVQIMSSLFDPDRSAERLPVSLITGFLGSGKTTLLNRLVQRPELADSAVIINEFGEVALDHLLVAPVDGETVVLASGCLCCAVRGDLQDTLRRLLLERERGEVPAFTRILIETSGLADPAPVAQLLLNNPLLGTDLRLDAIVATIDAVNASASLDQHWEARKQAALADRLLITKTDIAAVEAVEPLILSLRQLNPAAAIHMAVDGEIDPALLFGVGPADPTRQSPDFAKWLGASTISGAMSGTDHAHHHEVQSLCLTADAPLDWARFHDWLGGLRIAYGDKLLRVKGVLNVAGEDGPIIVHGVQHIFHPPVTLPRWPDDDRRSRLVLITRELDRQFIEESWQFTCL
jgi:G3E family GTPase